MGIHIPAAEILWKLSHHNVIKVCILMNGKILRYPDPVALAHAAASYLAHAARESVERYGFFTVALSGGHSPRELYMALAGYSFAHDLPWDRTFVFQADERCVPPDDPASNYLMMHAALLSRVPIPEDHVIRIRGELAPDEAAADYEERMRCFFKAGRRTRDGFPVFDCIALGVGSDGHTASLFPGSRALDEYRRTAVSTEAPERYAPRWRVTLTLPVIDNADRVFFLVPGVGKRDIMRRLLDTENLTTDLPAARVDPPGGCTFFTDFDL